MSIVLAVALGGLFGFVLQRVGATNPSNIINMLRLTDTHLMKAILFGIGFASLLLFAGMSFGLIDAGHLSVKASNAGVLIGGGILGLGFAIAGFCPGTGFAALGDGRRDAVAFVVGGLAGAGLFMLTYEQIKSFGWLENWFGGKATLAATATDYPALMEGSGLIVAGVLAVVFMAIAIVLPRRIG